MIIGIDFGTSYSYFAVKRNDGVIAQLGKSLAGDYYYNDNSGYNRYDEEKGIRTCIGKKDDWYVGAENFKKNVPLDALCTDIKTPLRTGEADEDSGVDGKTYRELAAKFFHMVLEIALSESNAPITSYENVDNIIIGMPARNDGRESIYRALLKNIMYNVISTEPQNKNLSGLWFNKNNVKVQVREEPFLASVAFLNAHQDERMRFCVIDIGGGTSDCTFIEQSSQGGNAYYVSECAGGKSPAGRHIDNALNSEIRRLYPTVTLNNHNEYSIIAAKEMLFANPGRTYVRTNMTRNRISAYKEWFIEYKKEGRRAQISLGGNSVPLIFDDRHKAASKFCFCGKDINFNGRLCVNFSEIKLSEIFLSDASLIKEACEKIKKNKPDALVFVGGTCCIHELRELICKKAGISVDQDDLFVKDVAEGRYNDGSPVQIYSSCNSEEISASNAVAHGAVLLPTSASQIYDKPYDIEYLLEMRGFDEGSRSVSIGSSNDGPIMSFDVMYNKENTAGKNYRYIKLYRESWLWGATPPSGDEEMGDHLRQRFSVQSDRVYIPFSVKINVQVYPLNDRKYGVDLSHALVWENMIKIHVLCDYDVSTAEHRLHLLVQCNGRRSNITTHNIQYEFVDYQGRKHTRRFDGIIDMSDHGGYIREYVIGEKNPNEELIVDTGWKTVSELKSKSFKEV